MASRPFRLVRRGALVLIVTACVPSVAHAAPRIAALIPSLRGSAPTELKDRFQDAVTRGITAAGVEAVAAGEVRMRIGTSEEVLSCSGPGPCAAKIAGTLRVEHTVASEIVAAGKDYTIRLKLLDATGRELARSEDSCDICTVKEADDAVARAAQKLAASVPTQAPPPAKVETPAPVETPHPKTETPPPPARVEAPPAAITPTPAERKAFPYRPVAIASLAAGVVGIAVGAALVAIDGQPTCTPPNGGDPKKLCKNVYDTVGGGGVLLGLGLAGVAAGSVLLYFDYRQRHKPATHVSIAPLPGGAAVSVGGRF